jgi:uncharacterized ferritin-like protein (DUF455 family)
MQENRELRQRALEVLTECDMERKLLMTRQLVEDWDGRKIGLDADAVLAERDPVPGLPHQLRLVAPVAVKKRGMQTREGRAALLHALAHIEFNAINLALDAVWRFAGMPPAYYDDWLRVAGEEALHFSLLHAHLQSFGYRYGDFPAHNSLWEMAEKTRGDVLTRMALVPRTLEARGLDVTPAMRMKFVQAGDQTAAEILDIILRDEVGHVAIGNRWFGHLCVQRGLDPIETYAKLRREYRAPVMRGPFNIRARRAAGFSEQELKAFDAGQDG